MTTATDIYGLGCVLHELLSGHALHDVVEDGRIPPPSAAAADNPARARVLRGDLDTLVGKAMHAEPERRYASVQALSDDVENYLAGRPLRAAPDSLAYRARKFIARHRYAAAGVAVIALLIAVFVWRLDTEKQRALVAEEHARREAQSAGRSRDFLVSLFEAAAPDNTLGHSLTARELIDKGSEHLDRELKDEPATAARLNLTIAGVYAALGDPKAAIASGERALALVSDDTPERGLLRAEILMTNSAQYDDVERFDDARRAAEEALALRQRYAPDDHEKVGAALGLCAASAVRHGEYPVARTYFDRALAEFAKVSAVDPLERAELLRGLADLDDQQGRTRESIDHAESGVAGARGAARRFARAHRSPAHAGQRGSRERRRDGGDRDAAAYARDRARRARRRQQQGRQYRERSRGGAQRRGPLSRSDRASREIDRDHRESAAGCGRRNGLRRWSISAASTKVSATTRKPKR